MQNNIIKKIYSCNISKLNIDINILIDLEKNQICKKQNDYYLISTNIRLNMNSINNEPLIRFNIMMDVAQRNNYSYLQITI